MKITVGAPVRRHRSPSSVPSPCGVITIGKAADHKSNRSWESEKKPWVPSLPAHPDDDSRFSSKPKALDVIPEEPLDEALCQKKRTKDDLFSPY